MFPMIQWQEFWELSTAWTAVFDGWNVNDKEWKNLNKKVRNCEIVMQIIMNVCQLKRVLYCPGSGHESLTTAGVSLVHYAFRVFLVLKPPLSMTEAFSKPIVWLCDQAWFTILEPLVTILTFLEYSSFFLVLKALPIWLLFCKTLIM